MALIEHRTGAGFRVGREAGVSVLWLAGEHDVATVPALRVSLAELVTLDDGDVVVDVGAATFVGSVMIGELRRARLALRGRDRWLTVRSPSPVVRRTFAICDATDLFDPRSS